MKKLVAAAVILAAAALFAVGQARASVLATGPVEFNTSAPPPEFTEPIYATPQGCTYLRSFDQRAPAQWVLIHEVTEWIGPICARQL